MQGSSGSSRNSESASGQVSVIIGNDKSYTGALDVYALLYLRYQLSALIRLKKSSDPFRTVNFPLWEHPTYQDLLKKADIEIDSEKRKDYMCRAEKLLMEEMPVIPICFNKSYFMCNKHLKGLHIPPSGNIDFRYAYFE